MMRLGTEADLGWMVDLCARKFGRLVQDMDAAANWLNSRIANPMGLLLRSDRAFITACIGSLPWAPKVARCSADVIVWEDEGIWEAVELLRAVDQWRQGMGAMSLHLASSSGQDLGPIVRRVGGTVDTPRYRIGNYV